MKTKTTTALLAFFFGGFGLHRFYLGQKGKAVVSLLFFWTLIPTLIGIIDFIVYISLEDERFTSQIAMQAMIAGGMKKSDRREKGSVDRISAAIILQSYLDSKNNKLI